MRIPSRRYMINPLRRVITLAATATLLLEAGHRGWSASLPMGASAIIPVWPRLDVPADERHTTLKNTAAYGRVTVGPIRWPELTVFRPTKQAAAPHGAIVICPGGGYTGEAMSLEGFRPARWFARRGFTCFVLRYRLPLRMLPKKGVAWPLVDVREAVRLVRSKAEKWHINPADIGVMGFSAGGSVAALAGVHWQPGNPSAVSPARRVSSRPDFMVLVYPVITMMRPYDLPGCTRQLLGPHAGLNLRRYYSAEQNVSAGTPPTYIAFAKSDKIVPHQNEREFYAALRRNGVPAMLDEFKHGRHAFGLGRPGTDSVLWPHRCMVWLRQHGFAPPSAGR